MTAQNLDASRARPGTTWTREGAIPHLPVVTEAGMVHAPVRLVTRLDAQGRVRVDMQRNGNDDLRLPHPLRVDGRLVYALPGGGSIDEDGKPVEVVPEPEAAPGQRPRSKWMPRAVEWGAEVRQRNLTIVRRRIVDDATGREIAAETGVTKARVHQIVAEWKARFPGATPDELRKLAAEGVV
jgi:hypothetical protein